ncbi:MAG: hypothetical protein ACAH59_07405 [Pseudobdellovibrionaceae bacterium]
MAIKLACFSCQKELSFSDVKIGFREECPHCRADVHVCKNCHFYDPKAYNECREPSADVVREKDRANFCEYFTPGTGGASAKDSAAALRAAAEALFKKS